MTALATTPLIEAMLMNGTALLAVNVSGGKDSQAMAEALLQEHEARGWRAQVRLIHAHLGRAEWPMTLAHVKNHAARLNAQLYVVQRDRGDMLQRWEQHFLKMRDDLPPGDQLMLDGRARPQNHWSRDGNARYCTAELKRGPINKVFTGGSGHRRGGWDLVVNAEGLRMGEGSKRQARLTKSGPVTVRPMVTAAGVLKGDPRPEAAYARWRLLSVRRTVRLALDWYPVMHWSEADVFAACGTSLPDVQRRRELWRVGQTAAALEGFLAHPAYAMGNERLSCALCILACEGDWRNGIRFNPQLAGSLIRMERESGWAFGNGGRSVEQVARAIGEDPDALVAGAHPFGEAA